MFEDAGFHPYDKSKLRGYMTINPPAINWIDADDIIDTLNKCLKRLEEFLPETEGDIIRIEVATDIYTDVRDTIQKAVLAAKNKGD